MQLTPNEKWAIIAACVPLACALLEIVSEWQAKRQAKKWTPEQVERLMRDCGVEDGER
jgi:hypothetical protein